MEIQTERLKLVPLDEKYLESTHRYASDAENTRYMMNLPNDTIEETREFLRMCETEHQKERPLFYEMAVIKEGVHIGAVSMHLDDNYETAELGWIILPEHQGCGYAGEAALALMRYAREKLSVHHFTAHCDSENFASEGVMKKLGFSRTGCCGGRKNRNSDEERTEYMYELYV
ncbi:MAG: GNAT family N-acetyltransferase [Oscillospiraceae bacterium]|nr:GNAT family N-acetyltransferase [Oscillospiraceae bacterium]